jgi:hypothetical protein
MAKSKKVKEAGRPAGSPNMGNDNLRTYRITIRVTEGYMETIQALIEADPKKSIADIAHEALQLYAVRKVSSKKGLYWLNRIL